MVPMFVRAVMMPVVAVRTALRLKRSAHVYKIGSEAAEHILDDMVGPNAKGLVLNFSGQMSISQMPSQAHALIGIFMSDFNEKFGSRLDLQPSSIIESQAISIRHCDRLRKIEKDIFAFIDSQANAAAMTRIEIESDRANRLFLRPMPSGTMN